MALPSMHHSMRAPSMAALATLESALSGLRISNAATATGRRHASHQAQGRANGAKQGPGKRLGAKKTGGQYVVPGNILFKQRGTHWFPGDGCFMGRDHTIHAEVPGYVHYYRDPARHKERKYIGVVFEKHHTLPQPPNAVRRRKLGMLAYQMPEAEVVQQTGDMTTELPPSPDNDAAIPATMPRDLPNDGQRQTALYKRRFEGKTLRTTLTLRPGYQWRQANWEIGRAAERSKEALKVKPFRPGDRWAAWRKRAVRVASNAQKRSVKRGTAKSRKHNAN